MAGFNFHLNLAASSAPEDGRDGHVTQEHAQQRDSDLGHSYQRSLGSSDESDIDLADLTRFPRPGGFLYDCPADSRYPTSDSPLFEAPLDWKRPSLGTVPEVIPQDFIFPFQEGNNEVAPQGFDFSEVEEHHAAEHSTIDAHACSLFETDQADTERPFTADPFASQYSASFVENRSDGLEGRSTPAPRGCMTPESRIDPHRYEFASSPPATPDAYTEAYSFEENVEDRYREHYDANPFDQEPNDFNFPIAQETPPEERFNLTASSPAKSERLLSLEPLDHHYDQSRAVSPASPTVPRAPLPGYNHHFQHSPESSLHSFPDYSAFCFIDSETIERNSRRPSPRNTTYRASHQHLPPSPPISPLDENFEDLDWRSGRSPLRATVQPLSKTYKQASSPRIQEPRACEDPYPHPQATVTRQTWPLTSQPVFLSEPNKTWRESHQSLRSFYQEYFDDDTNEMDQAAAAALTPTDGGLKGWVQVLCASLLFCNTWGLINAFGVFQTYYAVEMLPTTSNSSIAWIGTLTSFLLCASPLSWGPIFDRDILPIRLSVIGGSAAVVLGIMMTSLCNAYWQLILAQGLLCGLGGGCLFLTAVTVVPPYFAKRRALAMGVAAAGSSVGGIVYPLVFTALQPRIGFGWSVRCIGAIAFATLLVPCLLIERRRPAPMPTNRPPTKRPIFDTATLRDRTLNIFHFATFFGFVGQYIPFFFVGEYAVSQGVRLPTILSFLIILNIGSVPGRILPSLLADWRFHPLHVLAGTTACATGLAFLWAAVLHSTAGLVIWCLAYGFCSGAFVSLQGATIAAMTTPAQMASLGTRFGVNMFCGAIGILIGGPVAGALIAHSWLTAQMFCGATLTLSTLAIMTTWLSLPMKPSVVREFVVERRHAPHLQESLPGLEKPAAVAVAVPRTSREMEADRDKLIEDFLRSR